MELSWLNGWPAARQALRLEGDRRGIAATKPLFAIVGIDAPPNVLQICPSVRHYRFD
jgi:hypothetical protein